MNAPRANSSRRRKARRVRGRGDRPSVRRLAVECLEYRRMLTALAESYGRMPLSFEANHSEYGAVATGHEARDQLVALHFDAPDLLEEFRQIDVACLDHGGLVVLWHRHVVEHLLDHVLRGEPFGLSLVGRDHSMSQHIHADLLDVLGCHEAATIQECPSAGGLGQSN